MEPSDDAIAIVGIGCKVPGAENIREFWRVLLHGENHVVEIPPSRWNADAYYDPDPMAHGKTYVKRAGLVSESDEFDNKLYGINDFESAQMDPQQRFVLDCTLMALEDAGLTRAQIAGSKTGVFLGAMNSDYRGLYTAHSSNVGNYTVTGISNSIISARVSYVFDLRGPSLVLDTACSSSLIGIHLGCQAIRSGDCDMAIAGGTNYLTLPDVFVHLSKARMISPTGQCHSFSSKADGYTRGEGCGVVILKRLKDAIRDGDNIWATVSTGSNQDGHSVSPITAPSAFQQKVLMDNVFSRIGLDLSRVDYIEAHGTGTNAGDPVEANSLGEYFRDKAPRERYVGSVKTNIGHLESAAGVVGIIKVLLMMKHSKIAPSLHCEESNPKIDFPDLMLTVPGKAVDWDNPDKVSCCNSFGFGGSNSHAVLEYYKPADSESKELMPSSSLRKPCIVCFSAYSDKSLRGTMEELYADPNITGLNVYDVSYTSTARRDHYPIRIAHIVEDIQDLMSVLEEDIARTEMPDGIHRKPKITFVFCGMGTSWAGMCKELMQEIPVFREVIMQVEEHLKTYVDWSLTDRLNNETNFDDPEFSPIAIFASQVALAAVWRDLGIKPYSIVGQSVGEVAAAHAAGCISLEDAVKIVYHRSHLLATVTGGKMLIVRNVSVEKTRTVVNKYKGKASISLRYSPNACCISADSDAMAEIRADLVSTLRSENKNMQLMDLDVPVAYHSHHVDACTEPLAKALEGLVATPPDDVILVSAVTGERVTEAPGVDYWVANLRQPVLFDQAVVQSRDPKHKPHFVEIGPKPVLRSHLPDIFPKDDMPCVMSMSKPPEYKVLLQALVSLYQYGVDIKWSGLPTLGTKVTDVPRYVFDKKKNLAKSETAAIVLSGVDEKAKNHPYAYPLANSTGFKLIITPLGLKSVYDHIISGRIVIPGAFYAETGFAIAKHFNTCSGHNFAVAVDFEQALTVPKDGIMEIDVHFTENTKEADKWKAPIRVMREKRLLAHIRITEIMADQSPQEVINLDQIKARCLDEISRDTIYNALRSAGFQYGETFCLLEAAYKNNEECMATLRVHKNVMEELPGTTIHPSILDCMLQSSLVITTDTDGNGKGGNQKDLLPKALGRVVVHRPMEPLMVVHTRIRVRGQKQNFYDLKLLSTSGHIIAELDGLVINLIMEAQESSLPDMFTMEWSHVRALSPNGTMPEGKHVVYLTDLTIDKTLLSDQQVVASIMDLDFTQGMPPNIRQVIAANKKAHAFVLLCLEPVSDSIDSDSLDRHILNQSFLYKEMLLLANELALSAPIYLCTRNAWPSPIVGNFDQPVNPASTGLWGLCRTVLRERIYPNIVTVEFQMPSQDLTAPFFETTFDVLLKETKVQNHPELMVTPDGVHLNLIVIVDPETPIPMFRSNVVSRDKSALLLSSESSALVKPVAVLHDVTSASGPDEKNGHSSLRINAQAFALPSPALLKLKMQYERLQRDKASKANGYTVFSVEVMGTAPQLPSNNNKNHKNQNNKNNSNNLKSIEAPCSPVIACYPVAVGTQVLIPASATLRTDLLPGYELGDLTKLVVLFELQKRVKTPRVTVLASNRTRHFAGVLQGFFTGLKCGKVPYTVNVATADQLDRGSAELHETVISLVLLDGNTMASLTASWNNAAYLIICDSLLTSEALSCAYCFTQDMDVCVVDTNLLFQPASLKKLVPDIGMFAKKQSGVIPKVLGALHAEVPPVGLGYAAGERRDLSAVVDLADLLKFRKSEMTNIEVQVNKDELFREDSSYIVVGGLSGLGWICVQYLAEKGAGHIAIFNRRSPSPEQLANMENLSTTHACHVHAFQADVTSVQSLTSAFDQMQVTFSGAQIKGIFFGAAVTEDKSFLTMDIVSFDKALSPKVRGVWNLHNLTKTMGLDYFVMHSSVASVVGNGGQSNYAVGNAFLDGMSNYRRHLGLAAQAINWGALDTGILDTNDMAKQILESQGFLFMSPEEIHKILTPILMLNWPQCAPMKFDRERLSQKMIRDGILPLKNRLKKILVNTVQEAEIEEDLLAEVRAAKDYDPEKRLEIYEMYVQKLASKVLGVELNMISPDVSLVDLGLDSIVAMTMINQIHRDTSKRLPAVAFVTGEPTVQSIAEAIDEASEDGAEGAEDEEGGPTIVELTEEDPSVEASTIETLQLAVYKQHPKRESLHGTVDIPLLKHQANRETVERAVIAVLARHPSARAVFSEDNGPSPRRRMRRSILTTDKSFDLRVIQEDGVVGDSLDTHSSEMFDVHKSGPVRFIFLEHPKPLLRVVFHKAAFDFRSASVLVTDLTKLLESSDDSALDSTPGQALDTMDANKLNQKLDRLYKANQAEIVQFWEPKLKDSFNPSSLSFANDLSADINSEIGCVKLVIPPPIFQKLKDFVCVHDVNLLGVIGSCYQILLHMLTGETTIPLVFPVDLRQLGLDISHDMANFCNEIPLIATFGPEKMKRSMSLQNFVMANNRNMEGDIKHGVVPLSMFDSLSDKAQEVFNVCKHGIGIGIMSSPDMNGHTATLAENSSMKGCKAKHALKLKTSDGYAIMPRDLETNLMIEHLLSRGLLTLSLSFKRSLLDRAKADAILKALVFVLARLLTHPHTTMRKMVRRGRKIKRKLAKQSRKLRTEAPPMRTEAPPMRTQAPPLRPEAPPPYSSTDL
ncbi:hypothetical protein V1264_022408 [Littorina saxatilis]|uniref:Fatty acid synthase n=1 Tax=Littorina saxatilis TaxID=31220 RepID=A0AAN9AKG4_9CAEN